MPLPAPELQSAAAAAVYRLTMMSPVGPLTIFESGGRITRLVWATRQHSHNAKPTPVLEAARVQLAHYFDGRLTDFELPLAPEGSAFETAVWDEIAAIPFGRTETYGTLATRLGSAPRAVGRACGTNPIPIIIPCHRVLGAGGTLNGYSGQGGLATKSFLLRLEGVAVSR